MKRCNAVEQNPHMQAQRQPRALGSRNRRQRDLRVVWAHHILSFTVYFAGD